MTLLTTFISRTKRAAGTAAASKKNESVDSSSSSSFNTFSTTKQYFLFGYGSLINDASRSRTGITGTAIAARVKGFVRSWNVACTHSGMTAVGVTRASGRKNQMGKNKNLYSQKTQLGIQNNVNSVNGVLLPLINPAEDIPKFDKRERYYTRVTVDLRAISLLSGEKAEKVLGSNAIVYIYVANNPLPPSPDFPIVQSYLETILAGCYSFSREFALEFVQHTIGWESLTATTFYATEAIHRTVITDALAIAQLS